MVEEKVIVSEALNASNRNRKEEERETVKGKWKSNEGIEERIFS